MGNTFFTPNPNIPAKQYMITPHKRTEIAMPMAEEDMSNEWTCISGESDWISEDEI
jgi:hypothetical protein